MRRFVHIWLMLTLVMGSGATAIAGYKQQSGPLNQLATPVAESSGVHVETLVQSDLDAEVVSDGVVVLIQVNLAAGDDYRIEASDSPTLVYTTGTAIEIVDSFGFASSLPAETGFALPTGTEFNLGVVEAETAEVLIVRIQDSGVPAGPPSESTPETLFAETTERVLAAQPVNLPEGAPSLYLSRSTIAPMTATEVLNHSGAVGIYIADGSM